MGLKAKIFFLCIGFLSGFSLTQAITPDEALKNLVAGNQRYMRDELRNTNNNIQRRAELFSKQTPFAVILGCSDSRVPPEIIFDQNIGDLFVVRVAGNVVGSIEQDSIGYAALYLNSSIILVLGHENCGAVTAVLEGKTKDIQAIAEKISPGIQGISPQQKDAVQKAVIANVHQVVGQLTLSPVFSLLIKEGKLKIFGGYYDLLTGEVRLLEPPSPPKKRA